MDRAGTRASEGAGRRVAAVARRLARAHGPFCLETDRDPVDLLVQTILSQATSDRNSERAFASLKEAFPAWEDLLAAGEAAVAAAIRSGGLARGKSRSIVAALRAILTAQGELTLDHLRTEPVGEALAALRALPGVGPKNAACVLLFGFGRPAMPVDTHVHRVSRRLGLVPPSASAEAAHRMLQAVTPAHLVLALHLGLVRHGRAVCRARAPRCEACLLRDLCPSAPAGGSSARAGGAPRPRPGGAGSSAA